MHRPCAGDPGVRNSHEVGCPRCQPFAPGVFDWDCLILFFFLSSSHSNISSIHWINPHQSLVSFCVVGKATPQRRRKAVANTRGSRLPPATKTNWRAAPTSLPQAVALALSFEGQATPQQLLFRSLLLTSVASIFPRRARSTHPSRRHAGHLFDRSGVLLLRHSRKARTKDHRIGRDQLSLRSFRPRRRRR